MLLEKETSHTRLQVQDRLFQSMEFNNSKLSSGFNKCFSSQNFPSTALVSSLYKNYVTNKTGIYI